MVDSNLVNSTDAIKIIDHLQEIITPIGMEVYKVYYTQMMYMGIIQTIFYLILIFTMPYIIYKTYNKRKTEVSKDPCTSWNEAGIIVIIFAYAFFICAIMSLPDSIMHIINPDYYIIQELLGNVM